jgi:hypothetical protein
VIYPQREHAVFAAGLALAWAERPSLPFESFIRGVALHDRGYPEHDVDEIGAAPRERWLELQRNGFGEHDDDPVVDLVVSMHVRRLVGEGPVYDEMSAVLPRLRERAGVSEADAEAADRVTAFCDGIAFDVCFEGLSEIHVDPWPFAPARLDVLLVGYRAEGYPQRLERVVELIRVRSAEARVRA